MIFAHRCGSFRAHPFAIAAGVCLVLLIVASCIVFKQRRPELFAKALSAAEEKLRTAMVDAGRKEIDLATEGDDSKPAFVDLDGDGDLDFVAGEGDGGLVYYANGHCISSPKSCNGRGICDDSVVLLPLCNCLTGIAGAQCDRCQTGYYGSACDLCPDCLLYTSPSPRDLSTSRMPSSA